MRCRLDYFVLSSAVIKKKYAYHPDECIKLARELYLASKKEGTPPRMRKSRSFESFTIPAQWRVPITLLPAVVKNAIPSGEKI